MNFKSWLLISEMAKPSIESLKTKSLQALSENLPESDLKTRYKFLVSEWDKENNILTPKDILPMSVKEINWKCLKKEHTWSAPLYSRTKGSNCPCCSNFIACKDNNLQALSETASDPVLKARYKIMVSEWDKENNILTPKDVVPGSAQVINWKCKEGHTWSRPLYSRTKGSNCPDCSSTQKQNFLNNNNKNIKELGIYYLKNNKTLPLQGTTLRNFLNGKRFAFKNKDNKNYKGPTWYETDIEVGEEAGLPEGWYLPYKKTGLFSRKQKENSDISSKNIKELGIYYLKNNKTLPPKEHRLRDFLNAKRQAFKNKDNKNYKGHRWYETDIEAGKKAGLPDNWYLLQKETGLLSIKQQNFLDENNKKIKELGIYYLKTNITLPPKGHPLRNFSKAKRQAFRQKDFDKKDKTTDSKWYETDIEVGEEAGLPDDWYLPSDENISQGEEHVRNILYLLGVENTPQYKDYHCSGKTGRCLPFDFSFEHNNQEYFIEFHGEQHYYPVYFGSKKDKTKQEIAKLRLNAFEGIKYRDKIKYNYCKEEDFPLLVIPYWQENIEFVIKKFLKEDGFSEENEKFANPDVPYDKKIFHDRMYEKYLAESKPTELLEPKPTTQEPTKTFEQFLINKNFINI